MGNTTDNRHIINPTLLAIIHRQSPTPSIKRMWGILFMIQISLLVELEVVEALTIDANHTALADKGGGVHLIDDVENLA